MNLIHMKAWEFVKDEVIGFFKEFHDNSRFVKNLNTTFLVLIPKKQSVEDIKDLRLISLVGAFIRFCQKSWQIGSRGS